VSLSSAAWTAGSGAAVREAVAAVVPRCSRVSITPETLAEEYAMAPRKVQIKNKHVCMSTGHICTLVLIHVHVQADSFAYLHTQTLVLIG
jgi:hypothetical protein